MPSFLHKMRKIFFSPNSKMELLFRTFYHRVNATRAAFYLKDLRSKKSYLSIQKAQKTENPWMDATLVGPFVSFILPVAYDDAEQSVKTIQSLIRLDNASWQLIVATTDEVTREYLTSNLDADERVRFQASQSVDFAELKNGYIVICQPGDEFFPNILAGFYSYYHKHPNLHLYYYDIEYFQDGQRRPSPLCKPSLVTIDSLLSVNYFSRGFIHRDFLISEVPDLEINDPGVIEYDLAFTAAQTPEMVGNIPEVLVQQKVLMKPDRSEICEVIKKHLAVKGLMSVSCDQKMEQAHFSWATNNTHVAVIIPTKDHGRLLRNLLISLALTDYKDFSIYLVDNGSTDEETLNLYRTWAHDQDITIIPFNEPFNYSKAINHGVSNSESDLLLFLNDDMQVIHPDWLGELVRWAQRPEIGVVGTKLIRNNRTIQHAGIVIGLNEFVGHLYLNAPEKYNGLFGSVDWYRNYQALTGACQMVRRSVFEEVQGYDEDYRLAFGDMDFCLKVQALGYRNVYTPFAYLYHLEGQSRGYATPISDIENGYQKLRFYLNSPDPHYSEKLTLEAIPKYMDAPISLEERKNRIEERKRFYFN